jgi:hypothetical protein
MGNFQFSNDNLHALDDSAVGAHEIIMNTLLLLFTSFTLSRLVFCVLGINMKFQTAAKCLRLLL